MSDTGSSGATIIRIMPFFLLVSIGSFVAVGEYLLLSPGASLPAVAVGREFQIVHIVVSVLAALMVALAIAIKRARQLALLPYTGQGI